MHTIAIKALKEQIRTLKGQIDSTYQNEWCVEDSDNRSNWYYEIERLKATIEVLEAMQ